MFASTTRVSEACFLSRRPSIPPREQPHVGMGTTAGRDSDACRTEEASSGPSESGAEEVAGKSRPVNRRTCARIENHPRFGHPGRGPGAKQCCGLLQVPLINERFFSTIFEKAFRPQKSYSLRLVGAHAVLLLLDNAACLCHVSTNKRLRSGKDRVTAH